MPNVKRGNFCGSNNVLHHKYFSTSLNSNNGFFGGPSISTAKTDYSRGPIGKTLNYLRSKVDTAISTSALYPTREECRLWQESFEALLNHKYGCLLFRQFLKQEFSIENLEFWIECEEYKKLKETKKTKIKQRADSIYNTYVADGAVKEVNLDSTTKMATKAALENGATPDLFNLAQGKIEQLMAKDSYQRFLKSENYLELLNGPPLSASAAEDAADSVILRTGTNRDAALAKQQRQAACAARRHTCVPEQSETLAIQELAVRKMALKNDGDGMKVPGARNASIAEHVDAK